MKRYSLISIVLFVCFACVACGAGPGAGRESLPGPQGNAAEKSAQGQLSSEQPALPTREQGAAGSTQQKSGAATAPSKAQIALPGVMGQRTPGAQPMQRTPSWTPGANVTKEVATVAPQQAQGALSEAVKALKGKDVRMGAVQGYSGSATIPLPPALQNSFASVLGANAAGYYGLYNSINLAVTAQASADQAAGAMTLLVEPKAAMPSSDEQARAQLKQLFLGVTASLALVPEVEGLGLPAGLAYYGVGANTAYLLGYATVEGQIAAYVVSGSGSYQQLVPKP